MEDTTTVLSCSYYLKPAICARWSARFFTERHPYFGNNDMKTIRLL